MHIQVVFLASVVAAYGGTAGQEDKEFEALLLNDPKIQELMNQIESAKNSAEQHLSVVRDWLDSEVSFMRSWGAEHPMIELANTMRELEGLAQELDPAGKNAGAMKYLWIHVPTEKNLSTYWNDGWHVLEDGLENGRIQELIREVPLHPWSVLLQVEPRKIGGTTNFNQPRQARAPFFPDRPRPVLVALGRTGLYLDQMIAVMSYERERLRPGSDPAKRLERDSRRIGGLESFSPERLAAAQNARTSSEEIWRQWTLANASVGEMDDRIRAMQAFRQ